MVHPPPPRNDPYRGRMTSPMRSCLALLLFAASAAASEPVDSGRVVIQPRTGEPATVLFPRRDDGMARVIVEFAPGASAAQLQSDLAALARGGVRNHAAIVVDHELSLTIQGAVLSLPSASLPALRTLRSLRAVHPDRVVHALGEPGVVAVRAPEVWERLGVRGAGTTIAIIDTGVDYRHPSLGGGFGPGHKVRGGYDFVDGDDDPMDENGHGTHVAGIAAASSAQLTGVAPEAALLAFRVLDASGSGSISAVLAAIERAVDPNGDGDPADHADVINLSLGGPGGPGDVVSRAVDAAVAKGVVVCVTAGNTGIVHGIGSPGSAEQAITVGA